MNLISFVKDRRFKKSLKTNQTHHNHSSFWQANVKWSLYHKSASVVVMAASSFPVRIVYNAYRHTKSTEKQKWIIYILVVSHNNFILITGFAVTCSCCNFGFNTSLVHVGPLKGFVKNWLPAFLNQEWPCSFVTWKGINSNPPF